MKRIATVLLPLLLFLSACGGRAPVTPSSGDILTSVAQTLTALPSQTPAIMYVTPQGAVPGGEIASPTAETPPTATTQAPAPPPQTIIVVYPTAIVYPTPMIPTPAVPVYLPAYADQFIYYYYQRINARDYTTTWSLLTAAFKAAVNPTGYTDYVNYWNTVARVDIHSVSVTYLSGVYATVVVNMTYNYSNGYVVNSNQTYHLYYDTWRSSWMFDSASGTIPTPLPTAIIPPPIITTPAPTPVVPPYNPADFIYYYFSNINLRNYGLTWTLLSPSFIANNNPPSSGGFTGYVDFWNSVTLVQVTFVTVNSFSGSYATVTVGLIFYYTNGIVTSATPTYYLVYNYSLGSWQFYSPY